MGKTIAKRTAQEAAELPVGTQLALTGRLQSREYIKMLGTTAERRTKHAVSSAMNVDNEDRIGPSRLGGSSRA